MSEPGAVVLGADVGGTNIKIALARLEGGRPAFIARNAYSSAAFDSLEALVDEFLAGGDARPFARGLAAACFAVAGPVENGRARLTNLPWRLDEKEIARRFSFSRACLVNDFAAAALGIELLEARDLLTLQAGSPPEHADRVIVGAGTGLGVALLDWDETRYEVHPSEAGHSDFAPNDALQDELLKHLRREFSHVSAERVLSGSGLPRILAFLESIGAGTATPALKAAMANGDPAKAITDLGIVKQDELAARTLDLFASAYGSFAGNMALAMLAHGGVYIAGGIAPKIAPKLQDGTFMRAFLAKGRFQAMLETIPVHVVMNDQVGLYGALAEASRRAA